MPSWSSLVLFSVVALAKVYGGTSRTASILRRGSTRSRLDGSGPLSAGMLAAVFIYWGWDTAVTVNEEAKDARRTPGGAAVLSTLVLVAIYVVVTIAAESFHGAGSSPTRQRRPERPGKDVLGSPWDKLLIIAVLTSASASTQTTILPAGRRRSPWRCTRRSPALRRHPPEDLLPGFATLIFGAVSIVWYVVLTIVSPNDVLGNSIAALGFGIAFYYGITGYACVFYYRRFIFKSFKNFVMIGLAPLLGAVILTGIFVVAAFYYSNPGNSFVDRPGVVDVHLLQRARPRVPPVRHQGPGPTGGARHRLPRDRNPADVSLEGHHPEFFDRSMRRQSRSTAAPPLTPGVIPVTD